MPLRIDLAALTQQELEALLGTDASQKALVGISAAKLSGKSFFGAAYPEISEWQPLEHENWGANSEAARHIAQLRQALHTLGAQEWGAFSYTSIRGIAYMLCNTYESTTILVRWSEDAKISPYVDFYSLLKEEVAGVKVVWTSSAVVPFPLQPSEHISLLYSEQGIAEAYPKHKQHLSRFGKALKQASLSDGLHVLEYIRKLNTRAWLKRRVLVEVKE